MICRACLRARTLAIRSTPIPPQIPTITLLLLRRDISSFARQRHLQPTSRYQGSSAPPSPSRSTQRRPRNRASSSSAAAAIQTESTSPPALDKPDSLNDAESHIWDLIQAELAPTELSVRDISGGCGSMYGIEVSSEQFRGLGVLKQQRLVNAVLGDLVGQWHGVQLKTRVP